MPPSFNVIRFLQKMHQVMIETLCTISLQATSLTIKGKQTFIQSTSIDIPSFKIPFIIPEKWQILHTV